MKYGPRKYASFLFLFFFNANTEINRLSSQEGNPRGGDSLEKVGILSDARSPTRNIAAPDILELITTRVYRTRNWMREDTDKHEESFNVLHRRHFDCSSPLFTNYRQRSEMLSCPTATAPTIFTRSSSFKIASLKLLRSGNSLNIAETNKI